MVEDSEAHGTTGRPAVRTHAPDHDLLEPLPIFVDGVAVAPVAADRQVGVAAAWQVQRALEAVYAPDGDVRVLQPVSTWPEPERCARPPSRTAPCDAAFSRMIALPAERLASLPAWWRRHARHEWVEIAQRLSLRPPRCEATGVWRMRGWLRSPWRVRPIPVELELWPRFERWTKVSVQPQRDVHAGHRYFTAGHRALDALCSQLAAANDTA